MQIPWQKQIQTCNADVDNEKIFLTTLTAESPVQGIGVSMFPTRPVYYRHFKILKERLLQE